MTAWVISLQVYPEPGCNLQDAVLQACVVARRLETAVHMVFNGITLRADPTSRTDAVIEKYFGQCPHSKGE